MLTNVSHAGGVENVDEIQFRTPFGYMFEYQANEADALLPVAERTEDALLMLGDAMGEPGTDAALDSDIPAIFTYLGQFIDHDVTARTDRDTGISRIAMADGRPRTITPLTPQQVVAHLKNGRRPQLDLDSVYGDGPGLLSGAAIEANTEAQALYTSDKKLDVQTVGDGFDLPRDGRRAKIADMRNDENLNVTQLHAAFLAFNNVVFDALSSGGLSPIPAYIEARRYVRWAYQYAVVNDYLPHVCDPNVVHDVLVNGPRFFGPGTGGDNLFMPLEFAAAGFRFAHSMVRQSYTIRPGTTRTITDLLGTSTELGPRNNKTVDLLAEAPDGSFQLDPANIIHWSNFAEFEGHPPPQKARKIDPRLAEGLFDLSFEETAAGTMIRHLAKRNLMRGYLLGIPTGEAAAAALGILPLSEAELLTNEKPDIADAIAHGRFQRRTPLWYYILREAQVQKGGNSLGAVGSTIVAETLIGFVKHDPNSYLNNQHRDAVTDNGIVCPGCTDPVATIAHMLSCAGASI